MTIKKRLTSLLLAAAMCVTGSAFCFADETADAAELMQTESAVLLAAEDEKYTLPASSSLAVAETAKTAVMELTTFRASNVVSVAKYSQSDAAESSVIENNIFSLSGANPTLYADTYKYAEVVYYYDTETAGASTQKMGFVVGRTAHPDNGQAGWKGIQYEADSEIAVGQWSSAVFDISSFSETYPEVCTEGYVYDHIRVRPFGALTNGELDDSDIMYIKQINFYSSDPRELKSPAVVKYYETYAAAFAGGDDYVYSDSFDPRIKYTLREEIPGKSDISRWIDAGSGAVYRPGGTTVADPGAELFLYPQTDNVMTVYVSETGSIENIPSNSVYLSIAAAIRAIDTNAGIIYVSGNALFPSSITASTEKYGGITICGYNGTSDKVTLPTVSMQINRDITFENITVKAQAADERWIAPSGAKFTISENCVVEKSDLYTYGSKQVSTGLYIGQNAEASGNVHHVLKSDSALYTILSSVAAYSGSPYDVEGDFTVDLDGGEYSSVYAGIRNGYGLASNYASIYGDVTYNFNGGTYDNVYSGNLSGGYIYGNIVYNFNGGTFSGTNSIKIGNAVNGYQEKSSYGNVALVFNGAELSAASSNLSDISVSEQSNFASVPHDKLMVIVNNSEKVTSIAANVNAPSADYLIKVSGGKVTPVFAATTPEKGAGELLGFEVVSDNPLLVPTVGEEALLRNTDGYYDIPESSDGAFVTVEFANSLVGQYFTASFDANGGTGRLASRRGVGNTAITLPVCTFEYEGHLFAGWQNGDEIYGAGESYYITEDTSFSAVWITPEEAQAVYVDGENGDDENSGISRYSPLGTFSAALDTADSLSLSKIIIMSPINTDVGSISAGEPLTITALDDTEKYNGQLTVNSNFSLERDVTFEHMGLGSLKYQFICTGSNKVVFGDGLYAVDGTSGISAHLGAQYSSSDGVETEIRSGTFGSMYVGGAYLSSEGMGVEGDVVVTIDGAKGLVPTIGFDGYDPYNNNGTINGNVVFIVKSGSVSNILQSRLAGISGSIYMIYYEGASVPELSAFPEAEGGKYKICVLGEGEVLPADGGITAVTDDEAYSVKLTNSDGFEAIYEQGYIQLSPGIYTADFIKIEEIVSCDFTVDEPAAGAKAYDTDFAVSEYSAKAVWYDGDQKADIFESGKQYTVKINIRPHKYANAENLSSVTVNGSEAEITANGDGTYTASLTFPALVENIRYVSENGSDSNNGLTEETPYGTLKKALSALASTGGVVFVRGSVSGYMTTPASDKHILITGRGDPDASIVLTNNLSMTLKGDLTIDDISVETGSATHFNDCGYKLVFGDGVVMESAKIFHVGAYFTGKSYPSIDSSDVTIGGNSNVNSISVGGGYLTNPADGVAGDIKITINGAVVNNMALSIDKYATNHTSGVMGGNLLVTVNGGKINSVITNTVTPLLVSEDSTYQFIYNNGTGPFPGVSSSVIPPEKLYVVYSGVGGYVSHALDANGESISGTFDVIPDENHVAVIERENYTTISYGGRYRFNPSEQVKISYIETAVGVNSFIVDLDGGEAVYGMFSVDSDGNIHFGTAPQKNNFLFEGWYSDPERTKLITDGDYIGTNCVLYAKYIPFSTALSEEMFLIKGVQIRIPDESGVEQGLRFITVIDNGALEQIEAFSEKNSPGLRPADGYDTEYGTVVMPTEYLAGRELVCGGEYVYGSKTYRAKHAAAENLFASTDEKTEYTACITKIKTDKYERAYSARPYLKYYTRSGNVVTIYADVYSTDVTSTAFEALEKGNESEAAEAYLRTDIMGVFAESRGIEFIPQDVLESVNLKTEEYKQNVLGSESISASDITGTVYYVSPNGSDSNNGTSESTPWQTISKVNSASLSAGDAVLFERGGEFRGRISGKRGVTYSAYGTGDKPIINGSARNYADPSLWLETGVDNLYKLSITVSNVGLIAFDHSIDDIGKYDEIVGTMMVSGSLYDGEMFVNHLDLKNDLEFYSNLNTGELYLYSTKGNPGSRFASIEIAGSGNLFVPTADVVVDNLHFRYGGSHGVGGGGGAATFDSDGNFVTIASSQNITVQNCVFAWIGGSILLNYNDTNTTRYGNAVEMYGSCDGYVVENCWIYQIYDTGVTHQYSSGSCCDSMMKDVVYRANLIEYCHWSIEFYNQPCCSEHKRVVKDVLCEENIVRMGGYGWGSVPRMTGATLYNSFGLSYVPEETSNVVARNNIFFRSAGPIYRINSNASEENLEYDGNLHIQDYGNFFSWYKGAHYVYDNNVESLISGDGSQLNDLNPQTAYFYLP